MTVLKIIQCFKQYKNILKGLVILIIIGLSDEIVKSTPTTANILNPLLNYVGTKIRIRFKGSCLKQDEISFNRGKIVNIYIVYEINKNLNISSYPTLKTCLFGAVQLIKYRHIDQYTYSVYGIGFDRKVFFYLVMKLVETV